MLFQTDFTEHNKNNIVCKIRWVLYAVQLIIVVLVLLLFSPQFPYYYLYATLGLGLTSVLLHTFSIQKQHVTKNTLYAILFLDIIQWSILITLLGGISSPLAPFLVIPVILAAFYTSEKAFLWFLLMMAASLSAMILGVKGSIPEWELAETTVLYLSEHKMPTEKVELWKDWIGLIIISGTLGIMFSIIRHEAAKYSLAQNASSQAYQEYMRVASIGTMAAAAVHELGTPLNTIHLIATEMSESDHTCHDFYDDIQILASQTERCQSILKQLAKMNYTEGNQDMDSLGISLLIEQIAFPYKKNSVRFSVNMNDHGYPNKVIWQNEWTYAIGNILQNSFNFAQTRVSVSIDIKRNRLMITIMDDGQGFSKTILETVGDPYISGRNSKNKGNHMGLGLFIAKNLIEQTGGTIDFSNNRSGGACVTIACRIKGTTNE